MKQYLFLVLFMTNAWAWAQEVTISGKVLSDKACSKKVMVWLSLDKDNYKERLLLMHTEVPVGGTFRFYVRPGHYQVRASDESGCDYLQRVTVKGQDTDLPVKLVKK